MFFALSRKCVWLLLLLLPLLGTECFALDAVDVAASQIGKPYVYGATGPNAWDCSSLVRYSYAQFGVALPRTSAEQAQSGTLVVDALRRGDLLFFAMDKERPRVVTHVGIYESGNIMVNAFNEEFGIRRDNITLPLWTPTFLFARRLAPAQPPAPPPAPVNASINIPCTTANYLNVSWSQNNEADFANYKLYRATHPGVTTTGQPLMTTTNYLFYRDGSLAPGNYFYKVFVFNQAGGSAGSNTVAGRIFATEDVIERISGVPEPGDTTFASNVAIPNSTFGFTQFDCTAWSPVNPGNCDGTFTAIGPRIDCAGHRVKSRSFPVVTIQDADFNGVANLRYIIHQNDVIQLSFFAQDGHYTITQPQHGISIDIPQGAQRSVEFQLAGTGNFPLIVRDAGDNETVAGTITVVP